MSVCYSLYYLVFPLSSTTIDIAHAEILKLTKIKKDLFSSNVDEI